MTVGEGKYPEALLSCEGDTDVTRETGNAGRKGPLCCPAEVESVG